MQREHARKIRSERPSPWWPRPLGLALMGLAAAAAFDPEYPLPRSGPSTVSAGGAPPLHSGPTSPRAGAELPRLLAPIGPVAVDAVCFEWQWPDASCEAELVLLDDRLDEIVRVPIAAGCELGPMLGVDSALGRRLAAGEQLHCYVAATSVAAGPHGRTAPVAFWISR